MDADKPAQPRRLRLLLAAPLAVMGALAGYGVGRLLKARHFGLNVSNWSDGLAMLLAASMMAMGLLILAFTLNRGLAGRMVDPAGGRPASKSQLSFYRQQGLVMLLAGVMMALPLAMVIGELSQPLRLGLMAAIVLLFAVQSAFNFIVWRRADEFVRRLIAETSAVCFWLLQSALFLWAAGERLALLPPISAWTGTVVLMSVYLTASAFISLRRGAG